MHYTDHLAKDKKFKKLLEGREPFVLKQKKKVYLHLCGSIMSQQLSVKVADVIWKRFLALYDKHPTPEQIVETPFASLRGIGLSNAKVSYIQNVAKFAIEPGMEWKQLQKMSNEEVTQHGQSWIRVTWVPPISSSSARVLVSENFASRASMTMKNPSSDTREKRSQLKTG